MQEKSDSTTKTQFSAAMTTCSIISAMLVVWVHAYNITVYTDVSNEVVYWLQDIVSQGFARGAVPFFFMSSAFFLYGSNKTVMAVYKSRFKSIVVPYLLWNAVYMVAFAVLYRLSLSSSGMESVTVGNVLGGLFLHKYNYAFWFMLYLILFTAAYPALRWIISRGKIVAATGLLVLLVLCWFKIEKIDMLTHYYIGAVIGYYYRQKAESIVGMKKRGLVAITLALFLLSGTFFVLKNVWKVDQVEYLRDMSMGFLLFFTVVCCNVRIAGKVASLSFMLYALHPLILEMVEKVIYVYLPHTVLWMMVDYVVAPIVCIGLIYAVCWLWKKMLPRTYKLFNGGRI